MLLVHNNFEHKLLKPPLRHDQISFLAALFFAPRVLDAKLRRRSFLVQADAGEDHRVSHARVTNHHAIGFAQSKLDFHIKEQLVVDAKNEIFK